MNYFVLCTHCRTHDVPLVEFLNVEEDIMGMDVMTYRCPVMLDIQHSVVRSGMVAVFSGSVTLDD